MSIEELIKNEEFKTKIGNAQSLAEVVEILNGYGIEAKEEQLKAAIASWQEGELNEESLESVAGGLFILPFLPILPLIPKLLPIVGPGIPRIKRKR